MGNQTQDNLKRKIIEQMTVDYGSALEKNFDLAKQLFFASGKYPLLQNIFPGASGEN